jgi:invasion protein IalB
MLKIIGAIWLALAASLAFAGETAVTDEAAATEPATDEAASDTKSAEAASKAKEFKPPAGFVTKKRGALTLYCMKDRTTGTRFATEKCYDEAQMREYLLALEIQRRDVDRIRSTCANAAVCSTQ